MATIKGRRTWIERPTLPDQRHDVNFQMVTGAGFHNCYSFYKSGNGITAEIPSSEVPNGVGEICDLSSSNPWYHSINYISCRTIDFGDVEQTIAQETYDYIIANTLPHPKTLSGTWELIKGYPSLIDGTTLAHRIDFDSNNESFKFMNWIEVGGSPNQLSFNRTGSGRDGVVALDSSISPNYRVVTFKGEQKVLESVYNFWEKYAKNITPDIYPFYEYKNGSFKKATVYQCINGEIVRVSKGD